MDASCHFGTDGGEEFHDFDQTKLVADCDLRPKFDIKYRAGFGRAVERSKIGRADDESIRGQVRCESGNGRYRLRFHGTYCSWTGVCHRARNDRRRGVVRQIYLEVTMAKMEFAHTRSRKFSHQCFDFFVDDWLFHDSLASKKWAAAVNSAAPIREEGLIFETNRHAIDGRLATIADQRVEKGRYGGYIGFVRDVAAVNRDAPASVSAVRAQPRIN